MVRRLKGKLREIAYLLLIERTGERCQDCGLPPSLTPLRRLDIDHVDGDPYNDDPANWQLLCRSCNQKKENRRVAQLARAQLAQRVAHQVNSSSNGSSASAPSQLPPAMGEGISVYYSLSPIARLRALKEAIGYDVGPPEMRANSLFEPTYTAWLMETIIRQKRISKKEAKNSGAFITGCGTKAVEGYLHKLTSTEGPLQEVRDHLHVTYIEAKDYAALAAEWRQDAGSAQGSRCAPGGILPLHGVKSLSEEL